MVAEADKQAAKLEADAAKKAEKAGQDGEKASVAVLKAAEKDAAALTRASKGAITKVAERAWPGCSRASGSYAQAICPRRTRHPNPYPGGAGRQSGRARTLKRNEAAQMLVRARAVSPTTRLEVEGFGCGLVGCRNDCVAVGPIRYRTACCM